MRKAVVIFTAILILVLSPASGSYSAGDYPAATREFFVNDFAGVLDEDTERSIIQIGESLEDLTTAQVVLVTIDSLDARTSTVMPMNCSGCGA